MGNQLPRPKNYNGAPTSLAGDFQEQGVKLGQEYLYDANGNLTQDKNKGITGILYNHLNLPRQIRFGQVGDSVVFRYTASGQKVAKLVYQTGKVTPLRTDYLGPYQYEQDSLKFFPHAQGRVLRFVSLDPAGGAHISYQREFTFKDHLGNLRLAYRAGQTRTYLATLEQDANTRQRESQQFDSLSVSPPVAVATPYAMGQYAARLNAGGASPQPLGPLTQLTVQKGDSLQVSVSGLYPQKLTNSNFAFSLTAFVASLVQPAPAGSPAGVDGSRRGGLPLLQLGLGAGVASLPQLSGGVPKGYLRVLVFNQDSALIDQRTIPLTKDALGHYQLLQDTLSIRQNGYVSVYVGNESPADVYFDELRIEHRQGLQVQENQYDPAGMELAGLVAPSPGIRGLNNYRFNGKEFQADLGLAWNHQDWRFFDPQLLRWHAGDPELENGQESWTPYSFGYDNAIRYADADGRAPGGPGDGIWANSLGGMAVGAYKRASSYVNQSNARGQQLLQRLQSARASAGIEPTLMDKITDAPAAYAHAYLSGGAGNYTDQNDVSVLTTGHNFDGSKASGVDKGFAAAGIAIPVIGGTLLKNAGKEIWSSTKKLTSVENAFGHWKKHGKEFPGLQNAKQYVEAATDFLNSPPKGALNKTRKNGDVVVYDAATNTFGVKNANDVPKTMYKPDTKTHGYKTNLDYFNAQ
jgi:RHS repeat-associated protein